MGTCLVLGLQEPSPWKVKSVIFLLGSLFNWRCGVPAMDLCSGLDVCICGSEGEEDREDRIEGRGREEDVEKEFELFDGGGIHAVSL